jgi:hypothetical protein
LLESLRDNLCTNLHKIETFCILESDFFRGVFC